MYKDQHLFGKSDNVSYYYDKLFIFHSGDSKRNLSPWYQTHAKIDDIVTFTQMKTRT